jgi:hypothetical protein
VRRISSAVVSTCIVSSIVSWPRRSRPSDGGPAPEEAAAPLAAGTSEEECVSSAEALAKAEALAARQPRNGATWPEGEGRVGAVRWRRLVLPRVVHRRGFGGGQRGVLSLRIHGSANREVPIRPAP